MLWGQATHLMGVEFGLIFKKNASKTCILLFRVGTESKTQIGLLLLIAHFIPGMFGSGPWIYFLKLLCIWGMVYVPDFGLFPKCFNLIVTVSFWTQSSEKVRDAQQKRKC